MQTRDIEQLGQLGGFAHAFRSLRVRTGCSPEQMGNRIGVAATTVYRWEDGVECPTMMLLDRALDVLRATKSERLGLLCLLPRKRGIEALRAKARDTFVPDLADWMPGQGALIAAMRIRRNASLDSVASRLNVSLSTYWRWESAKVAVPSERLQELCTILGASEVERTVLESSCALLGCDSPDPVSLPECERRLSRLAAQHGKLASLPADLMFLCLEAQLWRHCLIHASAFDLLAATYVEHAEYLLWRGRERDCGVFAQRAITIAETLRRFDKRLMRAVLLNGKAETDSTYRQKWASGVEFLTQWQDIARQVGSLPTLYRDMAEYAMQGGRIGEALNLIAKSRASIHDGPNAEADARLADTIEARIHRRAGDPHRAVKHLREDDNVPIGLRIFELLLAGGVFLDLGDRLAAAERIDQAVALMETHHFEHLRLHADQLYARL